MVLPEPTWEQVLASFEASAEQAEALLNNEPGDAMNRQRSADNAIESISYDPWQLGLPALPDRLRARAEVLHKRQLQLAENLQAAMHSLRCQGQFAAESAGPSVSSVYVDRRM